MVQGPAPVPIQPPSWLAGGGDMGARVRALDWSRTPLGPVESWAPSLKCAVGTLLHSRHPMFLWWGPELVQIYNDAYVPGFGRGKHPAALGQPGRTFWQEAWPIIGPQIDAVMSRGEASWNEDQLVPVWRNGRIEEVYWTYGYSPVFAESGAVGGTLVVCTETTRAVITERRLQALRVLDNRTAAALSAEDVLVAVSDVLANEGADVPFAIVYRNDAAAGQPVVARSVALTEEALAAIDAACGPTLVASREPVDLREATIGRALPGGPWPEASEAAFIAELAAPGLAASYGFVVFGLSPRLPFDDAYRHHLEHLAARIAVMLARVDRFGAAEAAVVERERLMRELEDANRAKDEFLAMLGHELRNPLSPILTALHLMKQRPDDPGGREKEVIERQVSHLVRLVDDLLDISKITRGKVTLRRESLAVEDVIAKAVEMASHLLEHRRHKLSIEIAQEGLRVEGDAVRLAQVVANLLTNAARYTNPGGHVVVRARRDDTDVVISVEDNGTGIAPEMLPRIFDLFVQGQRSSDRQEGGLGLGLALVKSLILMHGGAVVARSPGLGKGTEIEVRLPEPERATLEMRREPSMPPSQTTAHPLRVLAVDDNVDAVEMVEEVLRAAGHVVAVAHDGPAALALLERFTPDVALLDIGLPVMDGYELGKRLHATPQGAGCRLIAITGYGQRHDIAKSMACGFEAHLVKPVDIDELLALVARAPDSAVSSA